LVAIEHKIRSASLKFRLGQAVIKRFQHASYLYNGQVKMIYLLKKCKTYTVFINIFLKKTLTKTVDVTCMPT